MPAIYLDHHATTPCDPAVVQAMLPYFTEHFGNASSKQHTYGMRAAAAVDFAREQVAQALGGQPHEIVFTSGATESNNLAILGVAEAAPSPGHIVSCATEHKAVLDPIAHLVEHHGWTATLLPPGPDGRVHPEQVADALRDDTVLVSLMAANNETGVLHPLQAIGEVCRDRGVLLHTDAAQALGRIHLDVVQQPVDLVSLTAHKLYGPKGVGALWVRRRGRPRVRIGPRQWGGGHEQGLRSGTLPVPLLVALGHAATLAHAAFARDALAPLAAHRDALLEGLLTLGDVQVHGSLVHRLPNNLNVSFQGVRSSDLIAGLRTTVACSAGSACSTGNPRPSHVLTAMGVPPEVAFGAVRFGLGRSTTREDITTAIAAIQAQVRLLRTMDPTTIHP